MPADRNGWVELRLLDAVEAGRLGSQREAAAELGIALGLVNAYLKRCVRKGWLKISQVPARRYAYYLTPTGFAEKARLTAEYLQSSLEFFRRARIEYGEVFARAEALGWRRVVLIGASDLAEVATLCALEADIALVAIVDPTAGTDRHVGLPVFARIEDVAAGHDGAVLTFLEGLDALPAEARTGLDRQRLLAPRFLSRQLFAAPAEERP